MPVFQEIGEKALTGLTRQRQALLPKFGWKKTYGPLVPNVKGDAKRAKAVQAADDWFFAQVRDVLTCAECRLHLQLSYSRMFTR